MTVQTEQCEGHCAVRIMDELTITTALPVQAQFADLLRGCPALAVDLSGISDIDTAGIQLLLALERDALRAGKPVRFIGRSVPLHQTLALYGLQDHLT